MKRLFLVLALALAAFPALAQQQPVFRPLSFYFVSAVTTGDTNSAANIGANTRIIRAVCTVACFIAFPVTPVVAASTVPAFLPANTPEYFRVSPGGRVSVRASSSAGTLYITEVE